ncbi:N-6 DNA methylase [Chelativorans sp. Marseille-P2723]|uniref:N-6 DNA methylase n=1 Tax=Chelativorans sp. Marseille-P2723 TaxID=2709133 RepID=UPI001FEEF685|nr:N-6 DNA methylase [Chelativorans sp. Marseille-P2723]
MARTARKKAAPKQLTTAQRLDSIIKSARKIMRKDKGLNGDLDRLPMLTWIMFLKFLDDMERIEEGRAELAGKDYRPIIEPPYRWRDWAADADGITGPDLLSFLVSEMTERPDGTRGPGLFAYLRALRGDNGRRERRDVIATVFQGFANRMESGYLLRDVVNLVDGIHFDSSEEVHTLGRLYETLLREMRDAAGDSGEFYTPRPVVRFMVEVTDPKLGETILDPACGTGGFLTEAFQHLERQADTVEKRRILQEDSFFGGEAKSLPFLLSQLNLLLHGLHAPRIDPGNALRFRLAEIGEDQRVNVILTNPPFGGEEEAGILNNFPEDRRTAETALLFLQLIMRRLKRAGRGRAAVVVPNGTLFGDGIAAVIKADLLEQFNLHTIVRLPPGVFEPYTDIATNLLFFDTSGSTGDVWFYEQPEPEGRKKYSKTAPMLYEEFRGCLDWWQDRYESDRAWKISRDEIIIRDDRGQLISCNLDVKNPHKSALIDLRRPGEIISSLLDQQRDVLKKLESIASEIDLHHEPLFRRMEIGQFLSKVVKKTTITPDIEYKQITVRLWGKGLVLRGVKPGSEIAAEKQIQVSAGQFLMSRIDARHGAFGIIPDELDGALVSGDFPAFQIDDTVILPHFFEWITRTEAFVDLCRRASEGSTNRVRLKEDKFLRMQIPVPDLEIQNSILRQLLALAKLSEDSVCFQSDVSAAIQAKLHSLFADP